MAETENRSTMRVPQPDIIEHFGNADAVPQLPERCLSRKAGIVRCCLRLSSSLKNRHRPGWRFLLFTTKPSVIVFRPTWKVNVKRMVLTSSRKWGQPPAVVCSACCRCSLKSTSHFVTQCNKLLQPHHKLWAIPHNSKCRYSERGAADAKPKAGCFIEHFGNADAVPQPSERCLSRKAGIVRCCLKNRE